MLRAVQGAIPREGVNAASMSFSCTATLFTRLTIAPHMLLVYSESDGCGCSSKNAYKLAVRSKSGV